MDPIRAFAAHAARHLRASLHCEVHRPLELRLLKLCSCHALLRPTCSSLFVLIHITCGSCGKSRNSGLGQVHALFIDAAHCLPKSHFYDRLVRFLFGKAFVAVDCLGRSEEPVVGLKVEAPDLPASVPVRFSNAVAQYQRLATNSQQQSRRTRLQLSRFSHSMESGHDVNA